MNDKLQIKILQASIEIEEIASQNLAHFFKITDWQKTSSFGTTSQSLSLNQKVNLLEDILGKTEISKTLFEGFMVIRNKFIHLSIYPELIVLAKESQQVKKAFNSIGYKDLKTEIQALEAFEELHKILKQQLKKLNTLTTNNTLEFLSQRVRKAILKKANERLQELANYLDENEQISKEEINLILKRNLI